MNGQDGSIYVSNNAYMNNSDYIIYFPNTLTVPTNGYIEVDFPEEYTFSPWMVDGNITLTNNSDTITSSSDIINRTNNSIRSTIDGGSVAGGDMLELNISNLRIHNPSQTGSYALTITTYDEVGAELETGTGSIMIIKPY